MSLVARIRDNLRDMRTFGPSVLARHFARGRADRIAEIHVPGIGPIAVRAGDSDMATLRQIFAERQYAMDWPVELGRRVRARYEAILAAGQRPIIVDAGANIGAASRWFAAQYPAASVVAIEPDPDNARILRRNLEGRAGHVVLEAAIGAEPGFVALSQPGMSWAVQTERSASGVPIVTVEKAFAAAGGGVPFLVKIDIEGFERDLFARNTGWIGQAYVVAIEPHDWMLPGQLSSLNFQRAMAAHEFELFLSGENLIYARVEDAPSGQGG